jgi:hypothetical protein
MRSGRKALPCDGSTTSRAPLIRPSLLPSGGQVQPHVRRECNYWDVVTFKRSLTIASLAILGVIVSPALAYGSPPGSPTDKGVVGMRAAALAWAHAVFTGTVSDIKGMEGSQCRSGPRYSPTILNDYLRGMRLGLQHTLGTPLRSIRITGVRTRNVTATTGDAEVLYALRPSVVGNDNWVSYGYQHGKWKVTSCHYPIGGESVSSSASAG